MKIIPPSPQLNPIKNQNEPIKTYSSQLKRIFYENSIFFALNNDAIEQEYEKNKDLSWIQKFKMGVIKGCERLTVTCFILFNLQMILRGLNPGRKAIQTPPSITLAVVGAVIEEIMYRGILQNCLAASQKVVTSLTPSCLQNNRVFKWLTSTSARILLVNTIFAHDHLANTYLTEKGSYIQAARILLTPTMGILHETTGNIIAPIACHVTGNFLGKTLVKPIVDKLYSILTRTS